MANRRKKKSSVMPVYAMAAAWVVWALCFPLSSLRDFILAGLFSWAVRGLATRIWKPTYEALPEGQDTPALQEPEKTADAEKETTGDPDLDAFILEGRRAVAEMNRLNDNIADPDISMRISRLTELTDRIFAHVSANPHKIPRARKFVNYYVPTTIKLLNAYDRMGAQGIEGENIGGTMRKIEDMLDTVVTAYEKQLDKLFSEEAMDISADITVMEDMIRREGLTDSEFDQKPTPEP